VDGKVEKEGVDGVSLVGMFALTREMNTLISSDISRISPLSHFFAELMKGIAARTNHRFDRKSVLSRGRKASPPNFEASRAIYRSPISFLHYVGVESSFRRKTNLLSRFKKPELRIGVWPFNQGYEARSHMSELP
jgi:hypothetical protein